MDFLHSVGIDTNLVHLLVRFALNIFFLTVIIRFLYYPAARKSAYVFTYYLIGIIVFFICYTLKKYDLDIGMALGLFAVFGIIRYRTDTIGIKEMTYLFVVIGTSLINALANQNMGTTEVIFTNTIIVLVIFIIEKMQVRTQEKSMKLTYEKIENIHMDDDTAFIEDLKERLGIDVTYYEVQSVDYLRDSADLKVWYKVHHDEETRRK
jgi:membrane protein insertase Oxa1/YidC/SpoIIIJ